MHQENNKKGLINSWLFSAARAFKQAKKQNPTKKKGLVRTTSRKGNYQTRNVNCLAFILLAASAHPVQAENDFNFETGNAPIEIVIPAAIPAIYEAVNPMCATLVVRFTTMITNSWFDATAPYHPTAVGVYSNIERRPSEESATNKNLNIAILHASYHTLLSLFPDRVNDWRTMMTSVGLNPDDTHEETNDPVGIGNAAAKAMLALREHDGMNQLGDEGGRVYNQQPYSDYTGYSPVNTAYQLNDPSRWQPNIIISPFGISRTQQFVTPQNALVKPYFIGDTSKYSVIPPLQSQWKGNAKRTRLKQNALTGKGPNAAYAEQAKEVLETSANLTELQKMKAELFDDKIRSLGFSTIFAALSNQLSLIEFVQYDFLVNAAAFDTGIVMWQEKLRYDAVRPFSAIHFLYGDSLVTAWGGPGKGTVSDIPGNEWRGYLHVADHPEYPSGSTGFCEAHAQASRLYFNSNNLDWTVPVPKGTSVIEPGLTPSEDINLVFATWSDFAEECGLSRFWGGVHFLPSIDNMRVLGREIGTIAHDYVMAHIQGTIVKDY